MIATQTILADALGLDASAIGPDTALGATAEWTSLAHLRLVLAVEEHLGRQLKPDEIVSLFSFEDVRALVEK